MLEKIDTTKKKELKVARIALVRSLARTLGLVGDQKLAADFLSRTVAFVIARESPSPAKNQSRTFHLAEREKERSGSL